MAEWVFCRHTHLDKWWPRVLKWFPVGVVDGTGHPSPLRGFSSLTAQHPVRFGTTGFLAPTQSNCRVDAMFLDQAASDDRRRERSPGDPDWSLPMGIGVMGGCWQALRPRVSKESVRMPTQWHIAGVCRPRGVHRGWKEDGRWMRERRGWSSAVLAASCPIQRGPPTYSGGAPAAHLQALGIDVENPPHFIACDGRHPSPFNSSTRPGIFRVLPHIRGGPSSANGDGRLSLHPPTLAGQHSTMHWNCDDLLFWTGEQSSIQAGPLLFDDRAMTEHDGFELCAVMAPCNIPRPEPPSTPTPGP